MSRADLTWFKLGFPSDLTTGATLAALASLSGSAHGTRLVFNLSATQQGITHRLAVTPEAADTLSAALRGAIPSLRLDQIDTPKRSRRHRLLWQLVPARAAIRTDELFSIAASLLASLFPLSEGEQIRLSWFVRPQPHPPLDTSPDAKREGHVRALARKLSSPGVSAYGELSVQASTHARADQLRRRLASTLWSLRTPRGRLKADSAWWGRRHRGARRRQHCPPGHAEDAPAAQAPRQHRSRPPQLPPALRQETRRRRGDPALAGRRCRSFPGSGWPKATPKERVVNWSIAWSSASSMARRNPLWQQQRRANSPLAMTRKGRAQ